MDKYTLLYLKWITKKDLVNSTWNSAQRYVAAWLGGEFQGEWIYVWLSLCCSLETVTILLIFYIPVSKKLSLFCLNINRAAPGLFWLLFAWIIFFHFFHFQPIVFKV